MGSIISRRLAGSSPSNPPIQTSVASRLPLACPTLRPWPPGPSAAVIREVDARPNPVSPPSPAPLAPPPAPPPFAPPPTPLTTSDVVVQRTLSCSPGLLLDSSAQCLQAAGLLLPQSAFRRGLRQVSSTVLARGCFHHSKQRRLYWNRHVIGGSGSSAYRPLCFMSPWPHILSEKVTARL